MLSLEFCSTCIGEAQVAADAIDLELQDTRQVFVNQRLVVRPQSVNVGQLPALGVQVVAAVVSKRAQI